METARVQIHTVEMASELAYMKTGSYPASIQAIDVQHRDDPWGRPFAYAVTGTGAAATLTISSLGPDGISGNADDVHLEKK